jgi:ribosomal protein S18 acetylase RimI-like enzyme
LDENEVIINLKEDDGFVKEYVLLRNHYCDVLGTDPVNMAETRRWLKRVDIEVMGLVRGGILSGVAILYLHRDGEIAFFTKDPNQGAGGKLLAAILEVARWRKLDSVWAWTEVNNGLARRVFEKYGFSNEGIFMRTYRGLDKEGIKFLLKIL